MKWKAAAIDIGTAAQSQARSLLAARQRTNEPTHNYNVFPPEGFETCEGVCERTPATRFR